MYCLMQVVSRTGPSVQPIHRRVAESGQMQATNLPLDNDGEKE